MEDFVELKKEIKGIGNNEVTNLISDKDIHHL